MSAHGSFIWYELMSPDPVAAGTFYGAVVGWQVAKTPDPAAGDVDYRLISRRDGGHAGGVLTLSEGMRQAGARPCWLAYLAVDDVDATLAAIVADGGRTLMPAMDLPVGRIAMVADPQGAPLYLMKPIPPAGQPAATSTVFDNMRAEHVRWNELCTSDPLAAIDFYARHFGWTQEGGLDMGELGQYRFVQHAGIGIGAVMPRPPEMPLSVWQFYIGVDDIESAVTEITAHGGHVLHGPIEIPGGEYAVNALDPQGAAFGLVGPRHAAT